MKEKAQKKKIHFEIFPVLIFIVTLFMSIVYAQISDIKLAVTGEVISKPQDGVFILDIAKSDTSSGVVSDQIKYYKGTTLSTSIELSTSTSSAITYDISLYNNSSNKYYFKGVSYDPAGYSNSNITYVLNGLNEYATTISANKYLDFTIQFKYKDGYKPSVSQILNSLLKFEFSNEMIEFKVAGTTYIAPKGATWKQFIESEYNTYGLKITNGKVYTKSGKQLLYTDKVNNIIGAEVKVTDIISESIEYIPLPEITLDKEKIELEIEEGSTGTDTLTAIIDNEKLELTWEVSPSDSGITISGEGNTRTITVTKGVESAVIKVSYGIVSKECSIRVIENVVTIRDKDGNDVKGKVLSTTSNTDTWDEYGNKIVIPAGFKVRIDDTTNKAAHVTEGIVIEDINGNQFVWIPVGTVYTNQEQTESETITLGRYSWSGSTPTLVQPTETNPYTSEVRFLDEYSYEYYSESLYEGGEWTPGARSITDFYESAKGNGGYYIGRYEAGDAVSTASNIARTQTTSDTNTLVCKKDQQVYNYVTQNEASNLAKGMYPDGYKSDGTGTFSSDLINSYAWDTAIIFIQTFGTKSNSSTYASTVGESATSTSAPQLTGVNILNVTSSVDEQLNIYDMAGNCGELSTEYVNNSAVYPKTSRGGYYRVGKTFIRSSYIYDGEELEFSFRPLLYLETTKVNMISFTYYGVELQAEEGMTWAEWCTSSYNPGEFHQIGGPANYIEYLGEDGISYYLAYDKYSDDLVYGDDVIIDGYYYYG